jgi:hypothetical protein
MLIPISRHHHAPPPPPPPPPTVMPEWGGVARIVTLDDFALPQITAKLVRGAFVGAPQADHPPWGRRVPQVWACKWPTR